MHMHATPQESDYGHEHLSRSEVTSGLGINELESLM